MIRNPHSQHPSLLRWLRWRLFVNTTTILLRESSLRVATVVVLSAIIWSVVFLVSRLGFFFLRTQNIPLAGGIVASLFDLLFFALAVLLFFSSGIILFGSLFSSHETTFLLGLPLRADRIFAHKFQGAIAFSSWGFLLLGSPILVAFGQFFGAPWSFYPLLAAFFIGFVLLPGSLGALACLLIVHFLPQRPRNVLAAAIILLVGFLAWWIVQLRPTSWQDPNYPAFIERLIGSLAVLRDPLAPNHWMTGGLLAAARGNHAQALFFLTLIWSNGLFLYLLTAWFAVHSYRGGYNCLATGGGSRRRYRTIWIDHLVARMISFLDPQTRLLLDKDFRTFRRDPVQWAQVLIFVVLIVLYFTNMRKFYQETDLGRAYQNGVSVVNLTATALLLCSYTGRFIYPLLSLEGRKFWILGLLPMPRERLLWGKFAFSTAWSLLVSEFLIVFCDLMLGMSTATIAVHVLIVAILGLGLSGLSVGLGAWMPNFRETDPSKIAVGFGGTLNLVAGLIFLLVELLLMAVPWHVVAAFPADRVHPFWHVSVTVGLILGVLLGLFTVWIPMRLGERALRHMEF
jgi:ABC-2 type transport system permease protein